MSLQKFNLETLTKIDNSRIALAFEQALARIVQDCDDRPGLKVPRKLTMHLSIKPICDEEGDLDTVNVTFRINEKYPERQTRDYNMRVTPTGLVFNELSPADARQLTLDTPATLPTKGN